MQFFTEIKPQEEPWTSRAWHSFREVSSLLVSFSTLCFQMYLTSSTAWNPFLQQCMASPTSLATGLVQVYCIDKANHNYKSWMKDVHTKMQFDPIQNATASD